MKGLGVLLLVTFVLAEPPYPPSGWQPSGERLRLPIRNLKQQAPVPHTVYGPPSTEAPVAEPANPGYLPPGAPTNEYGPPEQPANEYEPDNGYGPPQPDNGYGAPQEPGNDYGAPPQTEDGFAAPQQPGNDYGAPPQAEDGFAPPQQPDDQYGAPGNPEYETPEGSGQLPVDQGPSERLRQNQFVQQLPHFEPSRFRQQSNRLRQPIRQNFQSQRLQQQNFRQQKPQNIRQQRPQNFAPQRNNFQTQNFTPQRNNFQSQNFRQVPQNQVKVTKEPIRLVQSIQVRENFESQKLPKASPSKFQKQQLYTTQKPDIITTPKITRKAKPARPASTQSTVPAVQGPNIAVATAFSGRYYVLQTDGLLQEVTYKLKNGKLTDGQITPNLKYEQLAPITEPIYTFNKENKLVRIN